MDLHTRRYFLLVFFLAILAGCSDYPAIDSYFSFNIARSVDFQVPNTVTINQDTNLIAFGKIDTVKDYDTNGTAAYLLRTSEVTRCYLHSNSEAFTLDQLVYARVLIGLDTIAFDSIHVLDSMQQFPTDPFELTVTKKDITRLMQDTSYKVTLQCQFLSAPPSTTTITCGMTVTHTAASTAVLP
jgi:hypothetical protein